MACISQHPICSQNSQREHSEAGSDREREEVEGDWLAKKGDGDQRLTEVLFAQKRDNSGPKLEGKQNLWV